MNPKDLTSNNENSYAFMRKMFVRNIVRDESIQTYRDSSSYTHHKKMVSIGRQQNKHFYTNNNKREIIQSLRRLRSRL
ncbi:hypothetical protein 162324588 [Organic Lake phycodnavirus 2]|jgi:predicted SnoaL-like aldol condensation-catalyzing enzyme|nr:hypothetical protein 162324588 [Organic Lake phycodnavirus 2]